MKIDWFDLLIVQKTLKSLLQHHNLKASVLQCSEFFMVQLSHPHMTTGKTIALTIWTFVRKVMSLHFSMLTRFVMAFLPKSKCLLIQSHLVTAVILEPKKTKSVTAFTFSPSICHEVMGSDAMILVYECCILREVFHSPLLPSSRGALVPLHYLLQSGIICTYEIFLMQS